MGLRRVIIIIAENTEMTPKEMNKMVSNTVVLKLVII